MAAIDFPASPTNGQVFAASNGVTYRYVTPPGIWTAGSVADTAFTGSTPPASPQPNQLWWHSDLGQLYIYYNDGNSSQWVPCSPAMTNEVPASQQDGVLRLYSEAVLSAPGSVLAVTIPPLAKLVQLEYGFTNGGSANDNIYLQMMQSGVPLSTANYEIQEAYGSASTGGGVAYSGQVGWLVTHGHTGSGWFKTSYLASAMTGYAGGYVMGNGQYWEIQTGGGRVTRSFSAMFNAAITGGLVSITGFRLTAGINMVAGSYLRCFVVT